MRRILVLAFFTSVAACQGEDASITVKSDGGTADAGTTIDAGAADAGESDAGAEDAGVPEADAGSEVDAGSDIDAGSEVDAGSDIDAGCVPPISGASTYAYVVNYGESTLSAFAMNDTTGALTEIACSPFASPTAPWTPAVPADQSTLYVATEASVQAFAVNFATGGLTPQPGFPLSVSRGSYGISVDPLERFVFVNEPDVASTVAGYEVTPTGLRAIAGSPWAAPGSHAHNVVTPNGKFLYVAAQDIDELHGYEIDQTTGALSPIAGSPFSTASAAHPQDNSPQQLVVDGLGKHLYAGNYESGTVAAFSIDAATGALTQLGAVQAVTSHATCGLALAPAGDKLFVGAEGLVYTFLVDAATGALTAAQGSPLALGTAIHCGVAVHPTGALLLVSEGTPQPAKGTLHVVAIDRVTGALTPKPGLAKATGLDAALVQIVGGPPGE